MAIVFTTGTINAANAGAVGLAMVEKIRDDVTAHAAWELVEEYTPAGSLVTWYVFKCLAAESGLPSDFYVVIGRTIGSGELRAFICEGYTQATHLASGFCLSGSSIQVHDAEGRSPSTFTLSTAVLTSGGTVPKCGTWTPSGVSTKWWVTVDNDGFSVAFNGASNGFFHFGTFIPLSVLAWPMPLHMTGFDLSGAMTRNPAVAGVSCQSTALVGNGGGGGIGSNSGVVLGFQGRLDANDKLQSDQRPIAEIGMNSSISSSQADYAIWGWAIGKLKRVRIGTNPPAGIAFGDAYALQGRLWVPFAPTDVRIWDTGVAV